MNTDKIPEHIKQQIQQEARMQIILLPVDLKQARAHAVNVGTYSYCLALSLLDSKEKEVSRLKQLLLNAILMHVIPAYMREGLTMEQAEEVAAVHYDYVRPE